MKKFTCAVVLFLTALGVAGPVTAQNEQSTRYVIQKGDTLWGISQRFIKDPYYWPNLWAHNQKITNPHLIFPGQRLRIYADRIEIEDTVPSQPGTAMTDPVIPDVPFAVSGAEGYLLENGLEPAGTIIKTNNDRLIVGENDPVYTDIGSALGAKKGDRFDIFKTVKTVKHPITGETMGTKLLPLGTLELNALEENSSQALVIKSFLEIGPGSMLLPHQDRARTVMLKAATVELEGYIIEARMGNNSIGDSDFVYLDLGKSSGLQIGNMLYVVRDLKPDSDYLQRDAEPLPQQVVGALVVIDTGEKTATALVVKSAQELVPGDKVRLLKN